MENKDYTSEILGIIRSNASPGVMRNQLEDYHENDLAEVFPDLTIVERRKICRILDTEMLSDIFEHIDEKPAAEYLDEMDVRKAAKILSSMETDAVIDVLKMIPKEKRALLIELTDADTREDIAVIASFDDEEIGSRMTTNFIMIRENLTVKQAMSSLVEQAAKNDNISTIYVVDEQDKYYGAIDLKDLIVARDTDTLESIISRSYPYLLDNEKTDDCVDRIKEYAEDSLPVLTQEGKIAGIITSSDVVEMVDDAMGDDYAKLGGLTAEEDLNETTVESMKKRLPWLIALLFLGMLVSSVVGMFEAVVAVLPVVICFQSMVLDMAGNVGTQSLAVTIRVLMDENLKAKQKLGLILKEARIGLANGFVLGVMTLAVLGIYIHFFKGYDWGHAFLIAACVGGALITAMVISSIVGTVIPMFFHKIHVDPAVASGPLITTVNDLVAVITYYGLSLIILIDMFHIAG